MLSKIYNIFRIFWRWIKPHQVKPPIEEMVAAQCYDELDRLASFRRAHGRGRNPDAYQARHYCKVMRGKVKARLKELGAPLTRPGETKFYGPGQAPWQKGKENG